MQVALAQTKGSHLNILSKMVEAMAGATPRCRHAPRLYDEDQPGRSVT